VDQVRKAQALLVAGNGNGYEPVCVIAGAIGFKAVRFAYYYTHIISPFGVFTGKAPLRGGRYYPGGLPKKSATAARYTVKAK